MKAFRNTALVLVLVTCLFAGCNSRKPQATTPPATTTTPVPPATTTAPTVMPTTAPTVPPSSAATQPTIEDILPDASDGTASTNDNGMIGDSTTANTQPGTQAAKGRKIP